MHDQKSVRGQTECIIWGGCISSERKVVSADPAKIGQLTKLTCRVLRLGVLSPRLSKKLMGTWVHTLMFRRPLFSLIDYGFRWSERFPLDDAACHLGRRLRDELLGLVLLGPLCRTRLDARLCKDVYASDASLVGGAAAVAEFGPEEQAWIWSRAMRRGRRCRMAALGCGVGPPDVNVAPMTDRLFERWVSGMQFCAAANYDFRRSAHINILEAAALRTALRRCAKDVENRNRRICFVLDSAVVTYALPRRRSSSPRLNRVIASLMAEVVGAELCPFGLWVQSSVNPADDGSRGRGIRRSEAQLDPLAAEALRRVPAELSRPMRFADVGRHAEGRDRLCVVLGPNGSGRMSEVCEFLNVRCCVPRPPRRRLGEREDAPAVVDLR